tara:strand:+ start:8036 stop:9205 length:1170 start_codon:yes stop_codon:yes gene_type:complete
MIEIIPKRVDFDKDISNNKTILSSSIYKKSILVIGGAGTIGSNYIKQILFFKPLKIVVVDINENGLVELTRDLRSSNLLDYDPEYITYPINLLSDTFDKVFRSDNWDIVSNFSAHKHVRSEKDHFSVEALIKNNVFGAIKLLKLCENNPPKYFFSVSTDKAANPVNVMGASKSLMEKLILSKKEKFRVSTARFANVAFSNGSLLDGFNYRLEKKQPLSCPSDIKRFFVSPEQSGQICMLATFLGTNGSIFFPKLDFYEDQIYFKEITINFLKKRGYEPAIMNSENEAKKYSLDSNIGKYPVYFFKTDTSGEKAFEEFYTENEDYDLTEYDSLGFIKSKDTQISHEEVILDFESVFSKRKFDKKNIIKVINKYVPDFIHFETGKNLDQKM